MPKREDEFWATQREKKGQHSCPRCGNTNISYNEKFQSWRCNRCEHSFNLMDDTPEYIEETEKDNPEIKTDDKSTLKSKAWFGNEYFDKKTQKWKKPGNKTSSIVVSIIAMTVVIVIVVIFLLYIFVFVKPVS